jgi:hypothetical protein
MNQRWTSIKPANITAVLWLTLNIHGLGFAPKDVSTYSLCASGAMALLCVQVDTNVIKLLGHWRSEKMLWYLHVQAKPIMQDFASTMLYHGSFVLTPGPDVNVPTLYKIQREQTPTLTLFPPAFHGLAKA